MGWIFLCPPTQMDGNSDIIFFIFCYCQQFCSHPSYINALPYVQVLKVCCTSSEVENKTVNVFIYSCFGEKKKSSEYKLVWDVRSSYNMEDYFFLLKTEETHFCLKEWGEWGEYRAEHEQVVEGPVPCSTRPPEPVCLTSHERIHCKSVGERERECVKARAKLLCLTYSHIDC